MPWALYERQKSIFIFSLEIKHCYLKRVRVRVRVRVRARNINLEGLLQFMCLTSANWKSFYRVRVRFRVRVRNIEGLFQFLCLTFANWKSFYNSFLYKKRTVNFGVEPLTSNLQLSTQTTKPLSHVIEVFLTLSHCFRFLNISLCLDISGHFLDISLCLGHFMRGKKHFQILFRNKTLS